MQWLPFSPYMKGGRISVEAHLIPRYVLHRRSGFMNSFQLLSFSQHCTYHYTWPEFFKTARVLSFLLSIWPSLQSSETGTGITVSFPFDRIRFWMKLRDLWIKFLSLPSETQSRVLLNPKSWIFHYTTCPCKKKKGIQVASTIKLEP